MRLTGATESTPGRTSVFGILCNERRRRVLDALLERSVAPSVEDLVTHLAEEEQGTKSLHLDLVHVHLPALEDAGLLAWDRDSGTVSATDHPALDDPEVRRIVDPGSDARDDVVECLGNERRRIVLAVLEGRSGPTTRRTVACEVAEREGDGEPSREAVEEVLVALHHVHLPKLADAGLLEYDPDEATVVYRSDSELVAESIPSGGTLPSSGTSGTHPSVAEHDD